LYRISSFRRIQLAFGWWGILILVGGWLHNTYATAWGTPAILWIWVGLMALGLLGNYLLTPEVLSSGMLFIWIITVIVAFFLTWLIIYPLATAGKDWISFLWHAAFAIAYAVNGYYMDRRIWWLAGWEVLAGLFILLVRLNIIVAPDVAKNQGIALALSTGIPLLIAALPVWKERNLY
jgi:hypothetical protein